MSKQVREEFSQDAVVPVYRMDKGYYLNEGEAGMIKVTKEPGGHYIEAVVAEGE